MADINHAPADANGKTQEQMQMQMVLMFNAKMPPVTMQKAFAIQQFKDYALQKLQQNQIAQMDWTTTAMDWQIAKTLIAQAQFPEM